MKSTPIAAISLAALLAAPMSFAERSKFTGSTTVLAVEVPVNVVRDGEPVRGLTAEDFEVLDRGDVRPLVGFEVIDLEAIGAPGASAGERPEIPVAAQRHFLLLFDLSFTRPEKLEGAIAGARDLMTSLHATDRLAVAIFGLAGGVRIMHGFTSNHRQAERAVDLLERIVQRKGIPMEAAGQGAGEDPLGLVAAKPAALAAEIGLAAGIEFSHAAQTLQTMAIMGGRRGDPAEVVMAMAEVEFKELTARRRNQAITLAGSLTALSELTRGLDGRKFLVYFSEGFENHLLENNSIWNLGSASLLKELEKTFDALRREGWAIQSVDAGGVRGTDAQFDTTNSLALLASETGGDLFQNFNNLGTAMESLLERTSVTYMLVFQSPEIAQDGKFHPIKVRLKEGGKAQLRHRPGYTAPHPGERLTSEQLRFRVADKILSGEEGGDFEVATLVRSFRRSDSDEYDVALWIEADGHGIIEGSAGQMLETELYVYALDPAGEVRDVLTRRIQLDPERAEARLAHGGHLKFYGDFRLPIGAYDLRVLVRTAPPADAMTVTAGRYALRTVPVVVGDLSGPAPSLLGPVFLDDPERPSIVVRETEDPSATDAYPFRMGEGHYFPAVRPVIAAGRPTRISLMAYEIEGFLLRSASIVRRDGSKVENARLDVVGKDAHDGLEQVFFDFHPEGLEPGEYEFRVALVDPASQLAYASSGEFELVAAP